MFSFHKPKIYRSNLGCCICKAKSSSSRFTDSTKYENEFERCFRIQEKRSGEICNACVLLVKRFKKLSPEGKLTKHWHHVVDARAGPGTKLTGNRRLISNNASQSCNTQTGSSNRLQKNNKSDVLPLSSSQSNNQSGNGSAATTTTTSKSTRFNSSFNKARAIDTNVSTFTFGEPPRRSYMTGEPAYSSISSSTSSSYITKPQSSLNSTAFESVIKRFRQRQQQQQLNAKRREQNRQIRLQRQISDDMKKVSSSSKSVENSSQLHANTARADQQREQDVNDKLPPAKRFKRSSESMATLGVDIMRVTTLLDSSIWRKEKVCCGYIFRGLYNEVAILPKLLKPCQCRLGSRSKYENADTDESLSNETGIQQQGEHQQEDSTEHLLEGRAGSPPPRATKSGSISSCDSNTSGTGSLEQPLDEIQTIQRAALATNKSQQRTNSRKTTVKVKRNLIDSDNLSSSSGASISSVGKDFVRSPGSSSDNFSSHLMLINGVDDEAEDEELILDEEDTSQSSNDASSSVESLADKQHIAIG